jgi:myosin heavy subunit
MPLNNMNTQLSENVTLPDMTHEEAIAKHQELKSLHSVMRSMLLDMRDRKGWKALGFESWEQYGEKEWDYGKQYLYRLATASRIESIVSPIGEKEIPESQLRPLTQVPDDIKKQIWDEVHEENKVVTAKLIQDAVDQYKAEMRFVKDEAEKGIEAEQRRVEEWKQQYLDERNGKRELQNEIERVKATKKETVYIDDSSKALEQYREETVRKMQVLTNDLSNTRKELLEEKQSAYRKIEAGVAEKLVNYESKVTDLQKQETSCVGRIADLRNTLNALENTIGERTEQREAIKGFNKCLLEMKVFASAMLNDVHMHDDDVDSWHASFTDANQFTYGGLSHISNATENLPEIL